MLHKPCIESIAKLLKTLSKPPINNELPEHLCDVMDGVISLCIYVTKTEFPKIKSEKELNERANIVLVQLMFWNGKKSDDATAKCIAKWCSVCPRLNAVVDNVHEVMGRKQELFKVLQRPARGVLAMKVQKIVDAREAMLAVPSY